MSIAEGIVLALVLTIISALAALIFIGYRHMKIQALGHMEYYREFSTDAIFVGEGLEMIEIVKNPTWVPIFNLRIDFFVPAGITVDGIECKEHRKLTSVFNVPPFSTVKKTHTVSADKRNKYELHNAEFKYRKYAYNFDSKIEFYAYPDYFDLRNNFIPELLPAGNAVSQRKYLEDPFFVSGIREYRPGDPMSAINFKASARMISGGRRVLMCNNYDSSRTYDTMIFLDLNVRHDVYMTNEEFLEAGIKCACYLLCEAVKNGGRVGFSVNRTIGKDNYTFIPCESGRMHIKQILNRFAELNALTERTYSMSAILNLHGSDLPNDTDIYLITAIPDDKTCEALSDLERMGMNTTVVKI